MRIGWTKFWKNSGAKNRMIVEYEYTLEDAKRNAKQLLCYLYRMLLWPALVSAILGVVLVVLAFTAFVGEKIFLYLGCLLLLVAVFVALTFLFMNLLWAKNTTKAFAVYAVGGKERLSIELSDGVYVFSNLSKGNVARYSVQDILSVKQYRNLLIVKLASKEIVACPNEERVRQLFAQYLPAK